MCADTGGVRGRITKDSLNLSNSISIEIISFSKEIMRRFLEILERGILIYIDRFTEIFLYLGKN